MSDWCHNHSSVKHGKQKRIFEHKGREREKESERAMNELCINCLKQSSSFNCLWNGPGGVESNAIKMAERKIHIDCADGADGLWFVMFP